MNKGSGRDISNYREVCTWCGVVIRHNNVKESFGMCLRCYARMLGEHSRRYYETGRAFKSSER